MGKQRKDTGKAITPKPAVSAYGKALKEGTDYTLSYASNVNVGTASVTINGKGAYTSQKTATFKIVAAPNPLIVKGKTAKVSAKKVAKNKQTLDVSKVLSIKNAKGALTFVKKSGVKGISINKKTGKVTLKKGLAKKTYKVKVAVTAPKSGGYNKVTKVVAFSIKVK